MRTIYFFGYYLNWLEFVTYVIIPLAILSMILVYIYFNINIIIASFKFSWDDKDENLDDIY